MRILAQDGGSPPRTATTVATITVQRNINSPVFERQSYNETILETRQLGLSFLQVKATDGDTRVSPPPTVAQGISFEKNTNMQFSSLKSSDENKVSLYVSLNFLNYFICSLIDFQAPYNEVRYFMSTDAGSTLGAQYFMVHDVTGDISLRQSPMLDNARTVDYTVRF